MLQHREQQAPKDVWLRGACDTLIVSFGWTCDTLLNK